MAVDNDQIYRLVCLYINACNGTYYLGCNGWSMKAEKEKDDVSPFILLLKDRKFWN